MVNHDPCLKETTNVESYSNLFGDRKFTHTFMPYDNTYIDDYLIRNFTLAELKMLRRKQRFPNRDPFFNDKFQILTFEEVI